MARRTKTLESTAEFDRFVQNFPKFKIELTKHARDRMKERHIQLPEIRTALKRGSLKHVEYDIKTGRDKYRVKGRNADGRKLEVVVNLDETGEGCVTIVTAIDP